MLGATAVGLVGVLGFRAHGTTTPITSATRGGSGTPSPSTTTAPGASGTTVANGAAGRVAGPTTTTTTTIGPGGAPGQQSTTSTSAVAPAVVSATGTIEQYGYGEIAVKVTVSGARITATSVSVLQTAEQYSQQLAAQVIPTLRGQVLHAQTSRIDGVSGATYTSQAYALSVQSALDKLHFR